MAKKKGNLDKVSDLLGTAKDVLDAFPDAAQSLQQLLGRYGPQSEQQTPQPTRLSAWEILGLPDTASQKELDARYKALMKLYHTDKGSPTDAMAKRINEAYEYIREDQGWK